jgi:diguanylate cyclase
MSDNHRPLYTETQEQANEVLRLALPLMAKHRVAPHPHNFSVWYEYASGRNKALSETIDNLLKDGRPLTEELNQDLYIRFLARDERSLDRLRHSLRLIVTDIQSEVRLAGGNLSHYCETLEHYADLLDHYSELEDLSTGTQDVLVETRTTERTHQQLDERLATVVTEVESLRKELEQIREESLTDGLTGIGNRKAFDASLQRTIQLAEDKRTPFSVLMIDIDHFKDFNDSYGHLIGDRVLRFVATTLRQCLKGHDKPARFGGEEFTVILPRTFLSGAIAVAEQIRKEVASAELREKTSGDSFGRITISVGVAQYRLGESAQDLIKRVDKTLYRAKRRGRNRVEHGA